MPTPKVTIEFDVRQLERVTTAIRDAIERLEAYRPAGTMYPFEPYSIMGPDGKVFMFIDGDNQQHFLTEDQLARGGSRGWRQCFLHR